MKILEVCLAPNLGGLELYFDRCRNWFHGSKETCFSAVSPGSRLSQLPYPGPNFEVSRGKKWFPFHAAKELTRIIAKEDIDIVHVHHADDLPLVSLTKRLSKKPIKIVQTRQMLLPHSKKDLYHKWVYTPFDQIIAITDSLKEAAIKNLPLPESKIKRLYYGVDLPVFNPDKCNFEIESFKVGVFSRMEFAKGQHTVINALNRINKDNLKMHLYLFGDPMNPEYQHELEQSVELYGIMDFVHFMGFQSNVQEIMGCFDVIVLPSKGETFGLVLAEAMRAGVAVIGTNAGGVPEIIDDGLTGLLFEFDDDKKLYHHLKMLEGNPEIRAEIALAGKVKADKEFDTINHFEALKRIFEEL